MERIKGIHTKSLVPGLLINLGRRKWYQINDQVSYYRFEV